MQFPWEDPTIPFTEADQELLRSAELAATRCSICYHYGHRWEACPEIFKPADPKPWPEAKPEPTPEPERRNFLEGFWPKSWRKP